VKHRILLRSLWLSLFAVACGGKVVVDNSGAGGEGGAPSSSVDNVSSVNSGPITTSVSSGPSTSSVSSGPFTSSSVGTGPQPCTTCSQAISGSDPSQLCPGSDKLYDALVECICFATCAQSCGNTLCQGNQQPPDECMSCINDPQKGCGKELEACVNDL